MLRQAQHERKRGILLVVAAADAAGLDLEEGVFGTDLGEGELSELEGAGAVWTMAQEARGVILTAKCSTNSRGRVGADWLSAD